MVFKSYNTETNKEHPPVVYKGTLSELLGASDGDRAPKEKTTRASILDSVLLSENPEKPDRVN